MHAVRGCLVGPPHLVQEPVGLRSAAAPQPLPLAAGPHLPLQFLHPPHQLPHPLLQPRGVGRRQAWRGSAGRGRRLRLLQAPPQRLCLLPQLCLLCLVHRSGGRQLLSQAALLLQRLRQLALQPSHTPKLRLRHGLRPGRRCLPCLHLCQPSLQPLLPLRPLRLCPPLRVLAPLPRLLRRSLGSSQLGLALCLPRSQALLVCPHAAQVILPSQVMVSRRPPPPLQKLLLLLSARAGVSGARVESLKASQCLEASQ